MFSPARAQAQAFKEIARVNEELARRRAGLPPRRLAATAVPRWVWLTIMIVSALGMGAIALGLALAL